MTLHEMFLARLGEADLSVKVEPKDVTFGMTLIARDRARGTRLFSGTVVAVDIEHHQITLLHAMQNYAVDLQHADLYSTDEVVPTVSEK